MKLTHKFVTNVPKEIEDGVIYISMEYSTAIHKCCCGCGNEAVTPFSPTDWMLMFDGKTISLYPSIGNWGFECKSHYWITNSEVEWAPKWNKERIEHARWENKLNKDKFFRNRAKQKFRKFQKQREL